MATRANVQYSISGAYDSLVEPYIHCRRTWSGSLTLPSPTILSAGILDFRVNAAGDRVGYRVWVPAFVLSPDTTGDMPCDGGGPYRDAEAGFSRGYAVTMPGFESVSGAAETIEGGWSDSVPIEGGHGQSTTWSYRWVLSRAPG